MKTETSKIEWTDYTFNPWRGCTKVSAGCANCYAETLSKRNPAVLGEWGKGKPRILASAAMWRSPLEWNRRAALEWENWETAVKASAGDSGSMPQRPRVLTASLADWLDEEVPTAWLARLLGTIHDTPNLDWLLLTKRPQNCIERIEMVLDWSAEPGNEAWREAHTEWLWDWLDAAAVPDNVWIGTSIEDQATADQRLPHLLNIPAKIRFLSCEPLLGKVDLDFNAIDIALEPDSTGSTAIAGPIHWVICGGESGTKAREMHPDWARSLRDQCAAANVPFLFKQWGEWAPGCPSQNQPAVITKPGEIIIRCGKQRAGRQLDGQIHHAFPQP
mgnify:CR=1 FL=1